MKKLFLDYIQIFKENTAPNTLSFNELLDELFNESLDLKIDTKNGFSRIETSKKLLKMSNLIERLFIDANRGLSHDLLLAETVKEEIIQEDENKECENGSEYLNLEIFPVFSDPLEYDMKEFLNGYDLLYGWWYTFIEKEKKIYVHIDLPCN